MTFGADWSRFMGMIPETYASPESAEKAFELFKREKAAAYLAGGTELIPLLKKGLHPLTALIDLGKIPSMKTIEETPEGIAVGAMVTLAELSESGLVRSHISPVAQAAESIASPQIRNMATVGGNILQERRCLYYNQSGYWRQGVEPCYKLGGRTCHQVLRAKTCRAIYYSDLAPVLLAYGARARVYDGTAYQTWPLESVIGDHIQDTFRGHLLTDAVIPFPPEATIGRFLKYRVRGAIDFASSHVGLFFSPPPPGEKRPVLRIYAGAVASQPVRLRQTEETILSAFPRVLSKREEIIGTGLKELASLSAVIRETTISPKVKKDAFRIVVEALRDFLPSLSG
jgi:4-hydroxybenzoyl-CoA reductase subunit beta